MSYKLLPPPEFDHRVHWQVTAEAHESAGSDWEVRVRTATGLAHAAGRTPVGTGLEHELRTGTG
jgi:hypothetical protein